MLFLARTIGDGGTMFARRVARRTARRTARRQARFHDADRNDSGYAAELEELASLKGRGLISDTDYEAKRRKILGI